MKNRQTYTEDLEAWLWTTKGVRFYAHERCLRQNKWSNISIGILSAYIIIINLLTIYNIQINATLTNNHVAFITTALSILILVFSQLENSNDFKLKAEKFHDCSRELAKLYRLLREKKRELTNADDLKPILEKITQDYQSILDKYDNHKEIDYQYFKSKHPDDFTMSWLEKQKVTGKYYFNSVFVYHVLILSPFLLLLLK